MLTSETLSRHELIGLTLCVVDASNPDLIGISGTVIGETTNTLVVRPGNPPFGDESSRSRQVPKRTTRFVFSLPTGEKVSVDGAILCSRPARRTTQGGMSA